MGLTGARMVARAAAHIKPRNQNEGRTFRIRPYGTVTLASFVSTAVSTAESISAVASVVGSMAVRGVKAGIDGALHGGGKR